MYDVLIIGAGVTGCAVARELSRYRLRTAVLERGSDVCEGTSKANSGIAHAGYDAKPGSWKARMNVAGSKMMEALSRELSFPYERNGSLVLAFSEEDRQTLEALAAQGRENGVEGLTVISGDAARQKEPNLSPDVVCALWAPTGGIVDPFLLTIALAENAKANGVEFFLDTEVLSISQTTGESGHYYVITTKAADGSEQRWETRAVVNAAGVYADVFHNMVSEDKIHIVARKGEYLLMDKKTKGFVHSTIFQCPTKMGKGVLVTPTLHGNLLIGPTAVDVEDKEAVNTTEQGLSEVLRKAGLSARQLPTRQVITSFAGLRAHEDGSDFILGEPEDAENFYDAAGIESPGLTSAPAIGAHLSGLIAEKLRAAANETFDGHREGIPCVATATEEEREALVRRNPLYANVVCRCELVTEGEIVDAIRRPVGARTLDGIKRRVRAGMGRCQAGFCTPRQVEILARELGVEQGEITKHGRGSELLVGYTKNVQDTPHAVEERTHAAAVTGAAGAVDSRDEVCGEGGNHAANAACSTGETVCQKDSEQFGGKFGANREGDA